MESYAHQEWRARQRVSWKAIWQAALSIGGVLFLLSGGAPWTTAGTMNAIMGRDLPMNFWALLLFHFLVSFVNVVVIAHVIYRLRVLPGLLAGVAVGMVLYAINFAVFRGLSVQMQSPEFRAFYAHFAFSLFASAVYLGASVPKPFRGSQRTVQSTATDAAPADDPEPIPTADEPRK